MLEKIIELVIREGFQIHPELLEYLSRLDELSLNLHLQKIKRIIDQKKQRGGEIILKIEDLQEKDEVSKKIPKIKLNVTYDVSKHLNPIGNFDSLFIDRYNKLRQIWELRTGPKELTRIALVKRMRYQKPKLIGGLVVQKRIQNSRFYVKVEDLSDEIEVEVPISEFSEINEVVEDSFIVLEVEHGERGFTARNLFLLDIPNKRLKTLEDDIYVGILSDLHIGSKEFMDDLFLEILDWLVDPGKNFEKRICCIFFLGDIVSPSNGKSYRESYSRFFELLKVLPESMYKVVIPGECDATRIALPQPAISSYYLVGSGNVSNLFLLGNPCYVTINGIKILCYHGQSLDDLALRVPFGTRVEPARLGRILLKHRHLAPIYGGLTPLAPEKEDLLTISEVPDVFLLGHVHQPSEDFYKNVLTITASSLTTDSEKEGHLILLNLRNLETVWMF